MPDRGELTRLLEAWGRGDARAAEELMPLVFGELRRLAACYLDKERPDHTLQPTALVNEAYLRLVGQKERGWENRRHFFAAAAKVMRRILVDHARHHGYGKRGGGVPDLSLADVADVAVVRRDDLVALDEALDGLASFDSQKASIVELRYFVGLNLREISEVTGVSTATITRHWLAAKAWLFREIASTEGAP